MKIARHRWGSWVIASAFFSVGKAQDALWYSNHVNPFMGTTEGGNMFPGVAAAPFAVVKLGPDVVSGKRDAYSGYLDDGKITGFSMLHESGTGGAPKYGVVSQMPAVDVVANPLEDLSVARAYQDQAHVGYYQAELDNGVKVELAASDHAGVYQYTFPKTETGHVVIDVSHVLPSFRGLGWGQSYRGGSIAIDVVQGHYVGFGTYNNGWNLAPDWNTYFCGTFDQTPTHTRLFRGSGTALSRYDDKEPKNESGVDRLGAVYSFNNVSVTSYVGVSFLSTTKACEYIDELKTPEGEYEAFGAIVDKAKRRWADEVFSKIQVKGASEKNLMLLYSSLYGMHLIPSNRTGDNHLWDSKEPYYDDIFTLWDLFRCSTSLLHVLQPVAYEEMIRSFIDIWRHEGWMPDGRSSNFNGRTQGGSNVDNVLADAYVKGVRGGINWEDGFLAMQSNAMTQPPNNNDPSAPDASTQHGRGALPDWLTYHWITPNYTRAVSRAVEYAGNDFAVHQLLKGLGYQNASDGYLTRSRYWRNHWDPNASSNNHSGFVVPRNADGGFVEQNPLDCGGCYWGDAYYQGLPWEYSMNAHHDFAKVVELVGGPERMVDRIDKMFVPGLSPRTPEKFGRTIYDPTNQPSFTTPYLYNFVGRQDKSVARSRYVASTYYDTTANGLPGNSDAGAMQTWLLWNMIGLYPLTGQTTFLIGSPWFEEMTIDLGGGKSLRITTTGGDNGNAIQVQSLKVNGRDWDRAWVSWSDVFKNGGVMEFVLGPDPVDWATGDLPPSPATEGYEPPESLFADGPSNSFIPEQDSVDTVSRTVMEASNASTYQSVGMSASLTSFVLLALSFWL